MQIVHISTIGHSGSTVLDLLLGCHSACVGLGELANTLQPNIYDRWDIQPCSCGQSIQDCEFWGTFLRSLRATEDWAFTALYPRMAEAFATKFGSRTILIDSSKGTGPLEASSAIPEARIKVIHLVRDVRSWATSQHRRLVETRSEFAEAGLIARLAHRSRQNYFRLFDYWRKGNLAIDRAIQKLELDSLRVGYEELALNPESLMPMICEFLDLDFCEEMLVPANTNSHVATGNLMRSSEEKMRRIAYDDRWFRNLGLNWPVATMPWVMRLNRRYVYGNSESSMWEKPGQWDLQRPHVPAVNTEITDDVPVNKR